jgi:hypothetical protein
MMVGVIWIVQIVHYPLFDRVGVETFSRYARDHVTLITPVVLPLMAIEALTAVLLTLYPPPGMQRSWAWAGLILVAVLWLSTVFVQAPQHSRLSSGFNADTYQFLVVSNWIRTLVWTLRGLLVLWWLWCMLDS